MQAIASQESTAQLLVFHLDQHRYAIALAAVERVVHAVAVTPLPDAPPAVLGVIDVAGKIMPVFDLRCRFGLTQRSIAVSDHLLIARLEQGAVALLIDAVEQVIAIPAAAIVDARAIVTSVAGISGVVQLDGLVLIHDLEAFLSPGEALALEHALQRASTT